MKEEKDKLEKDEEPNMEYINEVAGIESIDGFKHKQK